MPVVLNSEILQEIIIHASNKNGCIPWNFALASGQNLKIFMNLLKNVRCIKFDEDRIEAIFGKFYIRFDEPTFSKSFCLKLMSLVTEISVVSSLNLKHLNLLQDSNLENINKATLEGFMDDGDSLYQITKLPIKHMRISASCLSSFINLYPDDIGGQAKIYQRLNDLSLLKKSYHFYYQIFDRNYLLQNRDFKSLIDREQYILQNPTTETLDNNEEYKWLQNSKEDRKREMQEEYQRYRKNYIQHLNEYESRRLNLEHKEYNERRSFNPSQFHKEYETVEIIVDTTKSCDCDQLYKLEVSTINILRIKTRRNN